MKRIPLSVGLLDFGIAHAGASPRAVVDHTLASAQRAETLGYTRYWLAEHHDEGCSWASPELVLGLVARATSRIQVGTGGLLFGHHNPLRVANDFALLSHLFPGRVELGLARGTAARNGLALAEPARPPRDDADGFALRLVALMTYLAGAARPQHAYMRARAVPPPLHPPPVWLLGTGRGSLAIAASYGLRFAHSVFHVGPNVRADVVREYARAFRPSAWLDAPRGMIALAGVCAETEDDARAAASDAAHTTPHLTQNCVGTPAQVAAHMQHLADEAGVADVLYLELSPRPEQRLRAYELLADELGLSSPGAHPTRAPAPAEHRGTERASFELVF